MGFADKLDYWCGEYGDRSNFKFIQCCWPRRQYIARLHD